LSGVVGGGSLVVECYLEAGVRLVEADVSEAEVDCVDFSEICDFDFSEICDCKEEVKGF